jgi:hypothetical protein
MNLIDEVRAEREDLARVLKKHPGIRRIVEDLYPDSAHFIYELLQNAEDTGATEAAFTLSRTSVTFEHNGRPFEARDVYAITDIGEGTKAGDDDKIGCFGVGFKAVFAYSETPHIWSPTFSFKITDLVLPNAIAAAPDIGNRTRFEFPFNNPKKSEKIAFDEIAQGLEELAETTLLFLSNLRSVNWRVDGQPSAKVARVQHSECHIEVFKQEGSKTTGRSHFLKFDRPVVGLEKQRVAAAFALDLLPNVESFDATKSLAKQVKIIPAKPGRVAVFFPADKEISGLRFHIHAPFVPELSRASVKETPANDTLFDQLAALISASLHRIRDEGLLTADFLEALPNGRDEIGDRYEVIRSAIVSEMNGQPLTPTHAKSHAPAKYLVQGKASLKSLLFDSDLEFLIDYGDTPPLWAVGVGQKNSNADRLLDSLEITEWDIEEFVTLLGNKTRPAGNSGPPANISPEQVQEWLLSKSAEWHQELYATLLTEHLAFASYRRKALASTLGELQIVRLNGGTHGIGSDSFFTAEGIDQDEGLAFVDVKAYTSGRGKAQKENAKTFLAEIGVREVGEAELVENILKRRYSYEADIPNEKTYRKDLKRFVALVENEPETAKLFGAYYIFESVEQWRMPEDIYLDQPLVDSCLDAYYTPLGEDADRFALEKKYLECGVAVKRLVSFALAVGATKKLEIQKASCRANSNALHLVHTASGNRTGTCVDIDYQIPSISELLPNKSIPLSQLIWKTLCESDAGWLTASYRNNGTYALRTAPSQLATVLKEQPWIPQTDGRFVRPAEADHDLLPNGFAYDPGWKWLAGIGFGQQLAEQSQAELQRREVAKGLGFGDDNILDRARRFAALPEEEQCRILAERETQVELPEQAPADPKRRAARVAAQAAAAPERTKEERTRSITINRDAIKQEAGQYLRQQYTNADGQMVCQVCKARLPFQLEDGSDYFERVELLPSLNRHYKENYVALCPNHAAMFQHANGTENLSQLIVDVSDNTLPVMLAKNETTIYFTKTHLADLKVIIEADEESSVPSDEGATGSAVLRTDRSGRAEIGAQT